MMKVRTQITLNLSQQLYERLGAYRRAKYTTGRPPVTRTVAAALLARGLDIAELEQAGDAELTAEQLSRMTPQESVMRSLLSQAMAYARQGGHVDAPMRLVNQTVAKAYLEGLREAGWMLVPLEADDGTVEALRDSAAGQPDSFHGEPATV